MVAAEYAGIAPTFPLDASHERLRRLRPHFSRGVLTTTHNGDLVWQWAVCDSGCSTGSSGKFTSQGKGASASWLPIRSEWTFGPSSRACRRGRGHQILPSPRHSRSLISRLAWRSRRRWMGPYRQVYAFSAWAIAAQVTRRRASRAFEFPCRGTALALAFTSGAGSPTRNISAITDSNGNTWAQPSGSPFVDVADNDVVALWYSLGTVCNAGEMLTLTMAGTNTGRNGEN